MVRAAVAIKIGPQAGPYQLFMLALSVLVLGTLVLGTFVPLGHETTRLLFFLDTGLCLVFFLDFLHSLRRAPNRVRYMVTWGWLDLLSSVPAVDVLRTARLARVLRIFRLLAGVRSLREMTRRVLAHRAQSAMLTLALLMILLLLFSGMAILEFEQGEGVNILTAEDALWWSFVTMTTVGYGDRYPVTGSGRLVAVVLMVAGIGLYSTMTGVLASWFVAPRDDDLAARVDRLERRQGRPEEPRD